MLASGAVIATPFSKLAPLSTSALTGLGVSATVASALLPVTALYVGQKLFYSGRKSYRAGIPHQYEKKDLNFFQRSTSALRGTVGLDISFLLF
jgi:hypothetical protein